ncbi:SpaA isopeptide-forming pilin-related protein [Clostridium sp. D33t1_170424_F3]|uniref:SpaA isopeptide-forming pilin-related protein n=1 Tax=Clostridium sp. D33t1_170424_F3 TaxID=2787099 RepID=UPI0018AC5091|nr:SpaA isopeptide-forming pilin-related protein [Clostridium sp. D33t1_170424_F3]
MKKQLKHLSALALALMMVISLCIPAMATSEGKGALKTINPGSTATIVVGVADPTDKAANGGDNLLAYQVVSITYNDVNNTLGYVFNDVFQAFLGDELGKDWAGLTAEKYCDMSEDEIKPLLGAFSAYIKAQDPKPEATKAAVADDQGVATFKKMPMGQYIILGDGASTGAKIYQTVTAEVEPEVKNVNGKDVYQIYEEYSVKMKTSTPSVGKDITGGTVTDEAINTGKQDGDKHDKHQQTASIGDEVSYMLTVMVPTYPAGATNKTFYMGDTLSNGLKFTADSIVVKGHTTNSANAVVLDGTAYTADVTGVAGNGGTFYVDFDYDEIAKYDFVTVEYKAVVTSEAAIGTGTGNHNDVELVYSNSPFDGNTWKPGEDRPGDKPGYGKDEDKEIVYSYALVIDKFEEKNEGEKLAGAQFEIYTDKACTEPVLDSDGKAVTLTTDANGAAKYAGLEKGTYYLKETVAPTGYNLMNEPVEITIDANNIPYTTTEHQTVTHYTYTTEVKGEQAKINGVPVWMNSNGEVMAAFENDPRPERFVPAYVEAETTTVEDVIKVEAGTPGSGYYKAGIANSTGMNLPSTGGIGTTLFYVIGGCLMLGAVVLMITKRRMRGSEQA